jgi:hypothetical protein
MKASALLVGFNLQTPILFLALVLLIGVAHDGREHGPADD